VWIRSLDAEIDHLAITKRDHTESERIDDVSTGMPIDRDECLRTAGQHLGPKEAIDVTRRVRPGDQFRVSSVRRR